MDWFTTIPLVVSSIGNFGADALQALAARLLTLLLAVVVVGGIGGFAVTTLGWLWLKRMIGDLHLSSLTPLRGA